MDKHIRERTKEHIDKMGRYPDEEGCENPYSKVPVLREPVQ